jgi:regulatory protein
VERLIDRREYATQELRDKLVQDGFDEDVVSEVLADSRAAGLVSDQRFGAAFIRSKLSSGWGTARIARELARRGICIDEVCGWPEQFQDEEDEESRALTLARRRVDGRPRCFERVVRHLCAKGYATSVAMRATRRALDELAIEEEQARLA